MDKRKRLEHNGFPSVPVFFCKLLEISPPKFTAGTANACLRPIEYPSSSANACSRKVPGLRMFP